MNKREISEIKKLYSPKKCSISRIAGCYVDGEKNKRTTFNTSFLGLPEEDMFKYFAIFKKSMSGTIGKTLNTLEFPMETEENGGTQASLLGLRNSKLKDNSILQAFYDKVIEEYSYVGNYVILLIYDVYDIPGKSTDNETMEDASTEVYEYIMCCICPMDLSKAGLGHIAVDNTIGCVEQNWMVGMPNVSFLFPAFNDRSADIHSVLTYCKKPDEYNDSFVKNILGCQRELTPDEQKSAFSAIVEKTLGDKCSTETVRAIMDKMMEVADDHAEDETPFSFDKNEIEKVISASASNTQMEEFKNIWEETVGRSGTLAIPNIVPKNVLGIKASDVTIKVNTARTDLIQERIIDGKKCLVIEVDGGIEYNGVRIIQ